MQLRWALPQASDSAAKGSPGSVRQAGERIQVNWTLHARNLLLPTHYRGKVFDREHIRSLKLKKKMPSNIKRKCKQNDQFLRLLIFNLVVHQNHPLSSKKQQIEAWTPSTWIPIHEVLGRF